MKPQTTIITLLTLAIHLSAPTLHAQNNNNWQPTPIWPFINQQFRVATVYTGIYNKTKTQVPCNIHIAKQTLWYTQNDTLLEAIPGTIQKVQFPNGDTYMPVGTQNHFGKIIQEDTINQRIARVICVTTLDQTKHNQNTYDAINNTQNILQSSPQIAGLGTFMAAVADANAGIRQEEQPLPLTHQYYFQVNGEIFPATTKNILAHIPPQRRKEYKTFTRTAEIISTNQTSILKIWNNYFLKQQ